MGFRSSEGRGEVCGGGETVLYFDCDHGFVCQNSQNFTLKGVGFTICKLCLNFFKTQERLPREFLLQLQFES